MVCRSSGEGLHSIAQAYDIGCQNDVKAAHPAESAAVLVIVTPATRQTIALDVGIFRNKAFIGILRIIDIFVDPYGKND